MVIDYVTTGVMKPVTEEQKALLEMVAEELNGKLYTVLVSDKHTEHRKIVIEYAKQNRQST